MGGPYTDPVAAHQMILEQAPWSQDWCALAISVSYVKTSSRSGWLQSCAGNWSYRIESWWVRPAADHRGDLRTVRCLTTTAPGGADGVQALSA